MFQTFNPATQEHLRTFPYLSEAGVRQKLSLSAAAHAYWSRLDIDTRAEYLKSIARQLESRKDAMALQMTTEMGKPITQAEAEVAKCAWLCDWYAENAARLLKPQRTDYDDLSVIKRYDAQGAVFGIMPWNFPLWQAMRYIVPALALGNVVLLKPAENVGEISLLLEALISEVTGDEGVFQCLLIHHEMAEVVISDDIVRGVTLTGSDRAGSNVAALAGKYIKKSVLELGGSDAFVVLEDANVEQAAQVFVDSRMNNTGQTCIAAKRAIVDNTVVDRFTEAVAAKIAGLKMLQPTDRDADIGCLARADLADNLSLQYRASVTLGARIVVAGGRIDDGCFFKPALLDRAPDNAPVLQEEVFGPVAVIMPFSGERQAVSLANSTKYGLGCSIWSGDEDRAIRFATDIDAGSIHINKLVSSDPRVAFGGVKLSGYGRELGEEGLYEFANIKMITIPK